MKFAVPMVQRVMHDEAGSLSFQPYGTKGEAIHSVSREALNGLLLDTAEALDLVSVYFERKLTRMGRDGSLTFTRSDSEEEVVQQPRLVIGADGAYSAVRDAMLRMTRANFSRHYIAHGYKELTIPPRDGEFALEEPHGLHIWPRGDYMMIALPNPDRSFTCTLFAPFGLFDELKTREDVTSFFQTHFSDAVPLMQDYVGDYFTNPTGPLVTVRLSAWNHKDRVLLIGDAAHAVVPFFGQGMNAAFEDCLAFIETYDRFGGDLATAVPTFATERRPAGDGIADLSLNNYVEMRDHTASALFLWRKRLETIFHRLMPNTWIPLYTMVAFTRIPYHEALQRGEQQHRILTWLGRGCAVAALGAAAGVAARFYKRA